MCRACPSKPCRSLRGTAGLETTNFRTAKNHEAVTTRPSSQWVRRPARLCEADFRCRLRATLHSAVLLNCLPSSLPFIPPPPHFSLAPFFFFRGRRFVGFGVGTFFPGHGGFFVGVYTTKKYNRPLARFLTLTCFNKNKRLDRCRSYDLGVNRNESTNYVSKVADFLRFFFKFHLQLVQRLRALVAALANGI